MVGRVIRKLGGLVYKHPAFPADMERAGRFGQLKVALVSDHLRRIVSQRNAVFGR
jgi:hypothetical protein